jgi:Lysine-specific metallo-endopeptidase
MGTKTYTGFDKRQEDKMRKIVGTASIAIGKAYGSHVKTTDGKEYCTWFGTGPKGTVKNVLHRMNYAMTNGTIDINFTAAGLCAIPGTNAVSYMPAPGWGLAGVGAAGSMAFNMDICPRLLNIMASLGSDNQSQVGTFLHELSHLLGGTNDVVFPGTAVTAYGSTAAKKLAKTYPASAVNNAENYGFYISSFVS